MLKKMYHNKMYINTLWIHHFKDRQADSPIFSHRPCKSTNYSVICIRQKNTSIDKCIYFIYKHQKFLRGIIHNIFSQLVVHAFYQSTTNN